MTTNRSAPISVALIHGDGIGPEITEATLAVLEALVTRISRGRKYRQFRRAGPGFAGKCCTSDHLKDGIPAY